jgi:predicted DNA-binding transcriptional regulator YafY
MLNQIEQAVHGLNLLAFVYDEKPRIVEPHAVGSTGKGKPVFRAFQTNGDDGGWKLFSVDKVEDLSTLDTTFAGPRPGYALNDKYIPAMLAQLNA